MDRRRLASVSAALVAAAATLPFAGTAATVARAEESRPKDWKAFCARIDALTEAHLKGEKDVVVAPRSDDAEFLRRVTLDLTGTIPTEDETVAFLEDPSPQKRSYVVDRLLASRRHAEWFATWYGNLLVGTSPRDRAINRRTFDEWLRDQFARDRPYDEMAYDLLTASGNSDTNGAVGYFSSFETSAADAAGKVSRHMLGVPIQCAQCHDHPYDKRIKQADFQSFAAFFFTTTHRRNQTPGGGDVSFDVASYPIEDLRALGRGARTGGAAPIRPGQPLRIDLPKPTRPGAPAPALPEPKFLLGKVFKDVPGVDRRTILARWITSKTNEWFSEAFANRMWAFFLGRGLVQPVDDFSPTNRPSDPDLLKLLADELVRSGFDVNHLVRGIVNSQAYQRTSKMPRGLERPDPSLFAVAAVRPLSVEQSFDALFRATGWEDRVESGVEKARLAAMGAGRRGLVDPRMMVYAQFRRSFQDDEHGEEETFTGTIPRGLLMMNGPQVNLMVAARDDSPLEKILRAERGDRERVRRIYLTVLSREPSPGETVEALRHVHTSRNEQEGYEDLLWALCNTTEFMSNH